MDEPVIRFAGVSLVYPQRGGRTGLTALDGLDLACAGGSVTAVIGPNGCGKSTLLRLAAGLLVPTTGTVTVEGRTPAAGSARLGIAFQRPRLLPWRSVLENVALPLEVGGTDREEAVRRARLALDQVGLGEVAALRPPELSGGMQQRAGLARALVRDPHVLLLDEPFSALDALTRDAFDDELARLVDRPGRTVVLVTHSVAEAVHLADRVVILGPRPGSVVAEVTVPHPRQAAPDTSTEARVRESLVALHLPEFTPWTPAPVNTS